METVKSMLENLIGEVLEHLEDNPQLSTYLQVKIEAIINQLETHNK